MLLILVSVVADYLGRGIAPANGTQCPTDPDLWSPEFFPIPDLPQSQALGGQSLNLLQDSIQTSATPKR